MKYITFAVPCYNSQEYMERCIDSLLVGGEDVEILIIDDGSTDRTGEIADLYEADHPGIVKAVHKENGGHGSAVNLGLEMAEGIFYKVVDSDDWLDEAACRALLAKIRWSCAQEEEGKLREIPDLFICNYIYDHLDENIIHVVNYKNVFPEGQLCTWNDIGRFGVSQYLVMHALVFRTAVLRRSGVVLPEHMFYVDNLFAYQPLPFVQRIYYMNEDLYHYYIGREDQSVNQKVLIRRIDQQIRVTEMVSRCVDLKEIKERYPKLEAYMCRNISIMLAISSIHLLLIGSREAEEKRRALWEGIRRQDKGLYRRLRYRQLSGLTYLPGRLGGKLTIGGYRAAKRIYRFQ